jgi:small conductance mechanosensitive channel
MEKPTVPQVLSQEFEQFEVIYKMIVEFFVTYSFQLVGAILILLLGYLVGSKLGSMVDRLCKGRNVDVTLSSFIASSVKLLIIIAFLIIALGKLGISIGPFVAALGAASLGVGLALQAPLSNYGAGFNLILTRPFIVGDTITIKSVTGVVKEIKLAYTCLVDEDDVEFTIPNKHIVGEVLANSHGEKLIELSIGIAYAEDSEHACELIRRAEALLALSSNDRNPLVGIDNFGDSSVNIGVRFWAPTQNHFEARYSGNQAIYSALKAANIAIPFPQREVTLLKQGSEA